MFLLGVTQVVWWPRVNVEMLLIVTGLWILLLLLKRRFDVLSAVVYFTSGLLYVLLAGHIQIQSELKSPVTLTFQGHIESLPKESTQKISFLSTHPTTNQTFLLNWYKAYNQQQVAFQVGALYQFEVNLKPPHGMANGVGFDREKWLFRNHIDGIGSIKKISLIENPKIASIHVLNQWRAHISELIDKSFSNQRVSGFIHALSIGDKSHFEHQDFQTFQNTGTAHLIAISGLHIGMVALLGWTLGSLIFWLFPQQKIPRPLVQIMFSMALAMLYAALAGFAVSTQRALIMLLVFAVYKALRRPSHAWDVWSTSLVVVLLLDPLNVLDAGFWLSFTAVAVLIVSFNGIADKNSRFVNFFTMQWRLLIGMLPLSVMVFSKVNLLAPLVNLLMIPLMTFFVVPLIMLMLIIASLFSIIPTVLIELLSNVSLLFLNLLTWFEQHTYSPLNLSIQSSWSLLLLLIGTTILILPKAIPQKFWGLCLLLVAVIPYKTQLKSGHFEANFLDVGQGLSVVIQTQNHQLIYDVGAAYESGFNMAEAHILPFLQKHHINHLDGLILSHRDNDHSGAAQQLISYIPVTTVWGTEHHHKPCIAGTQWQWDDVTFTFLSPYNLSPYLNNNSSCVLKIESVKSSLLLTGDIESPVEYRLSHTEPNRIKADVMLVPHHGSKTSSTTDFIQAVNPQLVINSSGKYNPFNHPASLVSDEYKRLNIPFIDTQESGLITLTTNPTLQLKQFRHDSQRIWRKKKPEQIGL